MSMSTSIRIPAALHQRLKEAAALEGTTVNRLIVEILSRRFPESPSARTRADLALADVVGSVRSEGGFDAADTEQEFGEILQRKHLEGRL